MRAITLVCLFLPLSAWAAPNVGDFTRERNHEVAIPYELGSGVFNFDLAAKNEIINQDIDWQAYQASSSYKMIFSDGYDLNVVGDVEWSAEPPRPRATYIHVPEIQWLSGKAGTIEVPIETDGHVYARRIDVDAPIQPQLVQEWTIDVTKLPLAGVEYDVYASIIPSTTKFTDVSVDELGRVYVPSQRMAMIYDPVNGVLTISDKPASYYRIDTGGLGQSVIPEEMPAVTVHRIAAEVVQTTQRLLSSKLILSAQANPGQVIRQQQVRFPTTVLNSNGQGDVVMKLYQLGEPAAHEVVVDQLGDVLPASGEIVRWDEAFAGNYVGTLVYGPEFTPRAPRSYGNIQSLSINKNGNYSGVIVWGGRPPLRVRGRFSAAQASSVSVEIVKGKVTKRGARLVFMRMADGSVSVMARCYFGEGNAFYGLAEKTRTSASPLEGKHTIVMPVNQVSGGVSSGAFGRMTIAKNSAVRSLWRLPDGKTISQSTMVSAQGMIPVFLKKGEQSLCGRLRHVADGALGEWTGTLDYEDRRDEDEVAYLHGACVGNSYRGWSQAPATVTIHLEDQNGEMTTMQGRYEQGTVSASGLELRVNPDGSISGKRQTASGARAVISGVALSSQDIWTCSSTGTDLKSITVTGIVP